MIAVGADSQDPQLDSSHAGIPFTVLGDELPSLSCDLGDLNISSSEIDQLLQGFGDFLLPSDAHMQHAGGVHDSTSCPSLQLSCDLASFFEDTPRPRDLNLSFPGENDAPPHIHATPSADSSGNVTPTGLEGAAAQLVPRASSPAWSESSGSMSTSSVSGFVQGEGHPRRNSNPIPRHKRPSHKRAEIKRRDKIKTCLDDIKDYVPSLRDKGKLSESTILTKAAEYVHHLKDGYMERGNKAAELRREIECLSAEIHSFQENLPAAGLKDDSRVSPTLDDLYQKWRQEECQHSTKFYIFSSITSKLFETFKEVVGPATTLHALTAKAQEWQAKCLALPVLRKQILSGMLGLSRHSSIVMSADKLKLEFGSPTDVPANDCDS